MNGLVLFRGGPWDGELRQVEAQLTSSIDVYVPPPLPSLRDLVTADPEDEVQVTTFRYWRSRWGYGGADVYAPCENPVDVRAYGEQLASYLCGCEDSDCPLAGVGVAP